MIEFNEEKPTRASIEAWANAQTTEIFNRLGVFFAFNESQFAEGKAKVTKNAPGAKIASFGAGGFVISANFDRFEKELDAVLDEKNRLLDKHVGKRSMIVYELANHECFYTGDISDAVTALQSSGVNCTRKEVLEVFREEAATGAYDNW